MDLSPFAPYLSLIEIVLAVVLIVLVVLQNKELTWAGFSVGIPEAVVGLSARAGAWKPRCIR